jgi:hypothetical protein
MLMPIWDPDPDWHQNNADPHADPTVSFTHVGKQKKNVYFLSQHCHFMYIVSHQCQMCHKFSVFWTAY